MDHGCVGFEDQKPKRNTNNRGLAQGVSEGSQGLIRVCARVHYDYIHHSTEPCYLLTLSLNCSYRALEGKPPRSFFIPSH